VNAIETSERNITASTDIKFADESLPVSGPNWLSVLVFWLRKESFSVLGAMAARVKELPSCFIS
jgi:hypothetical protein